MHSKNCHVSQSAWTACLKSGLRFPSASIIVISVFGRLTFHKGLTKD